MDFFLLFLEISSGLLPLHINKDNFEKKSSNFKTALTSKRHNTLAFGFINSLTKIIKKYMLNFLIKR